MRLVMESEKPITQVARELDVNDGALNWVAKARCEREGAGLSEDERAELVRLIWSACLSSGQGEVPRW